MSAALSVLEPFLSALAPPLCWGCGGTARAGEPLCPHCRAALRHLPKDAVTLHGVPCFAPVAYDGPARELVRALKYRGARGVAGALAAAIAARCPEALLHDGPALVPVPAHPGRARRRGFDQAERLAAALSARTGLAVVRCLARHGPARRQTGRPLAERLRGPAGSVELRGRAPRHVLLVDDVITTGATLAACAAALGMGPACRVGAVAYARTPAR